MDVLRSCCIYFPKITPTLVYQSNRSPSKNARNATIQDPVKGKTWRSLDLANQSHSNIISQNPPPTPATSTNTTTSSLHHNSLINNAPTSHYQRHDFKNRRSSSEPANEQKLLAHIQTHTNHTNTLVMIDDAPASSIKSPGDDFIDCLHQKNIKVSKKPFKGKIHLQSNTFSPLPFTVTLSLSSLPKLVVFEQAFFETSFDFRLPFRLSAARWDLPTSPRKFHPTNDLAQNDFPHKSQNCVTFCLPSSFCFHYSLCEVLVTIGA